MGALNDGLRFLLELAALGALGYWGFTFGGSASRWLLGIGAPVTLAVVWGLFIAPKAAMRTTDPERLVLELAVFGAAVAALAHAGQVKLAMALAGVVVVHLALTFPLDQR